MSLFTDESGSVKPWVTYAVVGLAVFGAGYMIWRAWHQADEQVEVALLCVSCGYTTERELEIGEPTPSACSKCGKESLYPAFHCSKCKAPNVWNANLGLKGPTKCRKCGAENYRGG